MKIEAHHFAQFGEIPLEKFNEQTWQDVDECRRIVGYQESPDWVCSCREQGHEYVCAQHPSRENLVAGFNCYPCLVKETKR